MDVWAVIGEWRAVGHAWVALRGAFPHLSELQLRAAVNHCALYPREVDERSAVEAEWTPERPATEMPFGGGLPG